MSSEGRHEEGGGDGGGRGGLPGGGREAGVCSTTFADHEATRAGRCRPSAEFQAGSELEETSVVIWLRCIGTLGTDNTTTTWTLWRLHPHKQPLQDSHVPALLTDMHMHHICDADTVAICATQP